MATWWVKSLQCKSNALEDVYMPKRTPATRNPTSPGISCGSSSQALRDVVLLIPNKFLPLPKRPHCASPSTTNNPQKYSQIQAGTPKPKPRPRSKPRTKSKSSSTASPPPPSVQLPTLADLPKGHSSRRVIEIIFETTWSPRGAPFLGEIEMLFRVHHPPRAVARFEEYRAAVRSRSNEPRCAADGNEMMRFHASSSSAASAGGIFDAGVARCAVGKLEGVRTFAGSGGAHESAKGGSVRRAMLVCRVIAGRIGDASKPNPEADSVCLGKDELLVFDPRAVLPCFLIIYVV
ncbi:hypothetical protein HPP92_014584 [Vanilla planifolia]|uniref:Uncharacterized protein n=1 Tax=Vanilla planifolia TaxID=51239 RepID=A0A835QNK5_VANPL|nr:hypothetical protein HPP92_014584 [Vanilla planifolia]